LIIAAALFLKRDPGQIGLLPYGYKESSKTGQPPKTSEFSYKEAIHFRQFWLLFAITLCYGIGMQTIMVHIVPYAMGINIPAEKATTIMATLGGVSIASRIILGGAADRIGTRTTYSIAFILAAVALLWLVPSNTLWMLYLFAVIYGFAYGGESALRPLMVADLFGLKSHGIINGTIMLNIALGGAIGPLMAARISETYGSYIPAFQICAVLGIIAFILTFLIKPTTSNEETPKGWLSKIWRRGT
jgi:MFS family permease